MSNEDKQFTVQVSGTSGHCPIGETVGIVVDDTVHFLSKYLRARREHDMTLCAC